MEIDAEELQRLGVGGAMAECQAPGRL